MSKYTMGVGKYKEKFEAETDDEAIAYACKRLDDAEPGSSLRAEIDAGCKAAVWCDERTLGLVTAD